MKSRGLEVYRDLKKSKVIRLRHPYSFNFGFDYTPKINCSGIKTSRSCEVKFRENGSDSYIYIGQISAGIYTTLFRRWYTNWKVEVFDGKDLIFEKNIDDILSGGKVCVSFDSSSLGDTLAWIPVIESFRLKHNCDLYVTTFWNDLISHFYPEIRFKSPGYREPGTNAIFGVGWYKEDDQSYHKRDPRTISLQQVAGDILGVDLSGDSLFPETPEIIKNSTPTIDGKYVCIAMESTANSKHWHYEGGWQMVVDYLNSIGYKVVVIQKQPTSLTGVINKTGNEEILQRAIDIYHSDFFIGVGSGLSWLAWALHKPVVMISGFSDPTCEFSTKNYRIINKNVCHGCFNDVEIKFDRGDWNWCPRLKNTERMFECTKSITFDHVKEKIDLLLSEEIL